MAESSSSKEPPPDIYKPLDKDTREIRLMEILPSEDTNATVELRLFRRRLEDVSGQFIPFSYVWGDPTDTKPIKVNGISTEVTCNLADLLRQTRTLLPDILAKGSWDKPAIFWAGAICINQHDPEERNHQVLLLKSIYSSAPLVLAWLGHSREAHLAASLAEIIDQLYGPEVNYILPNFDYSSWMQAYPYLWPISEDRNAYWEAFNALVQLPYWTRTWTFQEMVLPVDVLFMYGSSLIGLRPIIAVLMLFIALRSMGSDFKLPETEAHRALHSFLFSLPAIYCPWILEMYRTRLGLVFTPEDLNLTLVPRLAKHHATDPRDKVYGLLGVTGTRLEADYTKTTAQVYSEFVSAWIDEVKDFNFLIHSHEYHRITQHSPNALPSWAPDWEAISEMEHDGQRYSKFALFMAHVFEGHDASEQLPIGSAHLCDNMSTLAAPGVVVGKVDEVYPRLPSDKSMPEFALDVLQLAIKHTSCFGSQLEPSGSPPGPGLHILHILFRTIIIGATNHRLVQNRAASLPQSIALCFLIGVLAWAVDSSHPDWHSIAATYLPKLGIPPGQDFSRSWKEDIFRGYSAEGNMVDWKDAAAAMEWTWENFREDVETLREFATKYLGLPLKFVTNNGYLGIVTAAQAGDLVVVLAGCKAPVLLRRNGSYYEHVGPCFVVGLLEGEAKQMVDRGEAKIETFEIR